MKLIGIVGRAYYNRDMQKIFQVNENIREMLSGYYDVVSILLLPTNYKKYVDMEMGDDIIDEFDKGKLDYVLDKCDGFVVPGGTYWYWFDEYVIEYAIRKKKPLLGICLGFQAMCCMDAVKREKFDMTSKLVSFDHYGDGDKYVHKNIVLDNTLLMSILETRYIMVNSLHYDYVDFPMKELVVSSFSEDGVIEAVELNNHPFFLGVQWHPEYLRDEVSKKIFDKFVEVVCDLDRK